MSSWSNYTTNIDWDTCIDWDAAAEELQQDYTSVEYGDITYWIR